MRLSRVNRANKSLRKWFPIIWKTCYKCEYQVSFEMCWQFRKYNPKISAFFTEINYICTTCAPNRKKAKNLLVGGEE